MSIIKVLRKANERLTAAIEECERERDQAVAEAALLRAGLQKMAQAKTPAEVQLASSLLIAKVTAEIYNES